MESSNPFASFILLDAEQLAELRTAYPRAPEDYLTFLGSTGFGTIGSLVIYSGLIAPTDIFGDDERQMDASYRAFADFNGETIFAFDLGSWNVIELDSNRRIEVVGDSFSTFLDRWLARTG